MRSKTFSPADLRSAESLPTARALRSFARRLGLRGTRFAVNGILKLRFHVREHKLWEYARGCAFVQQQLAWPDPDSAAGSSKRARILDFGGAATLPVFYLASVGCEVLCLDVDAALAEYTNRVAQARGWRLRASTHDLVTAAAPAEWGRFDAAISFSVLEHIPKAEQAGIVRKIAALVRPGGAFALTFDFGEHAAQPDAVRSMTEVESLIAASGMGLVPETGEAGNARFHDTGERFALDKRHPGARFTFASLFLRRP